jgi:hypothetical protein
VNVAWLSTWERRCGIAAYSHALCPPIQKALDPIGGRIHVISQDTTPSNPALLGQIEAARPDIVHVQHEYGLWGGKNPPGYRYPSFVRDLRRRLPRVKLVATAHTALDPLYRFPVRGRGLQAPVRAAANAFLLPYLRRIWGPVTWGSADCVVVHSAIQVPIVEAAMRGGRRGFTRVIPHFVSALEGGAGEAPQKPREESASEDAAAVERLRALDALPANAVVLSVFGFITSDKGQDVAIEAL